VGEPAESNGCRQLRGDGLTRSEGPPGWRTDDQEDSQAKIQGEESLSAELTVG
jgi:hypothetical protein